MDLFCQQWEESERGWGVRPDGYSPHRTKEDVVAFVSEYWETMPDQTPREYSRPTGDPYPVTLNDDSFGVTTLRGTEDAGKAKYGVRIADNSTRPEAPDGWPDVWHGGRT